MNPLFESFYRGRKVLVVGADGFLGLNCVRALQALKADVSILSRRDTPRAGQVSGRVFRGDLRDPACVEQAIQGQSIVFDFAGVSGATESNRDPQRDLEQNCAAQLSLIHACAKLQGLSPLVMFCSSRLVYGKPAYLPVDETHPVAPQSMYAVHKLTVENYLQVLSRSHGLRYCILRLSNPYGPLQSLEARGYGIINQFIRSAAEGEAIRVFGDGSQLRDYIFVDEVCAVFLRCAQNSACHGEIFNLGGRARLRLIEAARRIASLAGGTPVRHVPWPKSDESVETGDYCSDLKKLAAIIELPPPVPFETGVARTLEYYRQLRGCLAAAVEPPSGCADGVV